MGQTSSCQSLPHFLCVLLQPGFRLQVLTDPGRQLLVSPDLSTAHSTTIVKQASNFRFALINLYLVEDPDLSTAHSTTIVNRFVVQPASGTSGPRLDTPCCSSPSRASSSVHLLLLGNREVSVQVLVQPHLSLLGRA